MVRTDNIVDIYLRNVESVRWNRTLYTPDSLCVFFRSKDLEVYCLTGVCTVRAMRVIFDNYLMALTSTDRGSCARRGGR